MNGPYPMLQQTVMGVVPTTVGAYVLGTSANRALYVARTDNLRAGLLAHFAQHVHGAVVVERFWFAEAPNTWAAYDLECQWYHQFSPTHNATHPIRPPGRAWGCPICGR
jgi:excinuclease UvrABC nuclease subunit